MSHEAFGERVKKGIPTQSQETLEENNAQKFWQERLQGETRIGAPQDPRCEFAIVVPAYNEKPERLLKQIESLRDQRGVDSSAFEIVYVVNNDVADDSEKSKKNVAANQEVIQALQNIPGLSVFAIDKSSPGHEISECNVGKARNRGIAEASLRFHENGKNGVLIQTDADCYFEDPEYLQKVTQTLRQNPNALGIAGGFVFEFDPDTSDPAQVELLKRKIDRFKILKEWEYMIDFLRDPAAQAFLKDDTFVGPNVISRSFETAAVGGLDDINLGEQDNFTTHLNNLATKRGHDGPGVLGMKKELVVVTALRESDRTGGSFKAGFDAVDLDKPLVGPDPLAPAPSETRQKILTDLQTNMHNPEALRKILSDNEGNLLCDDQGFQELVSYLGTRQSLDITEPFFITWQQKYSAPLRAKYDAKVTITPEGLQQLESQVLQHPDGKKFMENMRARLASIRIKE